MATDDIVIEGAGPFAQSRMALIVCSSIYKLSEFTRAAFYVVYSNIISSIVEGRYRKTRAAKKKGMN